MKHYVYSHTDPIDCQIKYIGKGSMNRAYEIKYRRSPVHLEWVQYLSSLGFSPIITIIAFFENENDAYEKEKELIYELISKGTKIFNRTPGGRTLSGVNNPMYGRKRQDVIQRNKENVGKTYEDLYGIEKSIEIKSKIAKKGELNGMYGKKRPELAELGRKNSGKTYEEIFGEKKSAEIKEKLSAASSGENNPMYGKSGELAPCYGRIGEKHPMYGKTQTKEARSKISESLKLSRGKKIIRSDGKTYSCLIDAAKDLGLKDQKEITKVLKGFRSNIKGFTFKYL